MYATLLKIYPSSFPDIKIRYVTDILKIGGVIISLTDTVYGIGCYLKNRKAVDKLYRIKNIKLHKLDLSFICDDLSSISRYAENISTLLFKLLKKTLLSPYTFILNPYSIVATTVIECRTNNFEMLREGPGSTNDLLTLL